MVCTNQGAIGTVSHPARSPSTQGSKDTPMHAFVMESLQTIIILAFSLPPGLNAPASLRPPVATQTDRKGER